MEVLCLLLKNKLRYYRRLSPKWLPFFGVLLVFLLFFIGELVPEMKNNRELLGQIIPVIYQIVLLLIAGRRILSKYPPFYFSLPGLYFFFTTPVNHRLVLTGRLLLSYFPILIISLGLSLLAQQVQAGLFHGAQLFFYLVATTNISWLLYNSNSKRLYILRLSAFIMVLFLIYINISYLFWLLFAVGGFFIVINSTNEINWSKYDKHCKLAYLTTKHFLSGDWGSMETLTYEYKENPGRSILSSRVYVTGFKAFTYGQMLILSRYPFITWVLFLGQCTGATIILQNTELLPFMGGSLLLLSGFVSLLSVPIEKIIHKHKQGFLLPSSFNDFLLGMIVLPMIISLVALMIIISILTESFNPLWPLVMSILPAIVLSYLIVLKGVLQSIFSGWFITGALLFGLVLYFTRTTFFWGVFIILSLFVIYLIFSWRRMKIIYEGYN